MWSPDFLENWAKWKNNHLSSVHANLGQGWQKILAFLNGLRTRFWQTWVFVMSCSIITWFRHKKEKENSWSTTKIRVIFWGRHYLLLHGQRRYLPKTFRQGWQLWHIKVIPAFHIICCFFPTLITLRSWQKQGQGISNTWDSCLSQSSQ